MVHAKRTTFLTQGEALATASTALQTPLSKGLDGEAGLVQIGGESPTSCPRNQGNVLKAIDLHHRYA
jgi:hypothetical protein